MARLIAVLLVLGAGSVSMTHLPAARAERQAITISASDLLEHYEAGDVAAVRDNLRRAASGNLASARQALARTAPAWIEADGSAGRARRTMMVGLVALETAHAALGNQWSRSRELIEWGASFLERGAPSENERGWHLAALALCEGARDSVAIATELGRLQRRFPGEPRIMLGHAFLAEITFWDEAATSWGKADLRRPMELLLAAATSAPQNRDEAMLRLAYLALYDGKPDVALEYLAPVVPKEDDAAQRYYVGLFGGWINQRLGRREAAVVSFQSALAAAPAARTAAVHLSAALYTAGRREEAARVIEAALRAAPESDDPWTIYGYGDLRRFTTIVDRVRVNLE